MNEAKALAQPDSEGKFVLVTGAGDVAISGNLHQWQGFPRKLRPIVFGSKKFTATKAIYGAPKLEMYASFHLIPKNLQLLLPSKIYLESRHSGPD